MKTLIVFLKTAGGISIEKYKAPRSKDLSIYIKNGHLIIREIDSDFMTNSCAKDEAIAAYADNTWVKVLRG